MPNQTLAILINSRSRPNYSDNSKPSPQPPLDTPLSHTRCRHLSPAHSSTPPAAACPQQVELLVDAATCMSGLGVGAGGLTGVNPLSNGPAPQMQELGLLGLPNLAQETS